MFTLVKIMEELLEVAIFMQNRIIYRFMEKHSFRKQNNICRKSENNTQVKAFLDLEQIKYLNFVKIVFTKQKQI